VLLRTHDQNSSKALYDGQNWAADPHFVGRDDHLCKLQELLDPGNPVEVEPVVIHGMTGCGKTSLASQFAAKNSAYLRPIFINALSRPNLVHELTKLIGETTEPASAGDIWRTGVSANRGPVTPDLPFEG
jgi:hypothetical protein